MLRISRLITFVVAGLTTQGALLAQQATLPANPTPSDPLSHAIARLKAAREAQPPAEQTDELTIRRARLQEALAQLREVLARSGQSYEQGWKTYLHWNDLEQGANDPQTADPQKLRSIQARLAKNHNGLELRSFMQVRERLREYTDTLAASRAAKPQEQYQQVVTDLAERLERYQTQASGADGPEIARQLAWLESMGRETDLVAEVQRVYSTPNVEVNASAAFLARAATRPVNQTQPVTDCILGTHLTGTAHMTGQTTVDTAPSLEVGTLCLRLNGLVCSDNVGRNGPATIFTTGRTTVSAVKPILLDEHGIRLLPASAQCDTESTIHDIQAKLGLIERIAWKKAGKQKALAEEIGSQHAEQRIAQQLDREVEKQVAQANTRYQEEVRKPLLRRGIWPKWTGVSSQTDGLSVQILHRNAGQLAAKQAAPSMNRGHDVVVKTHESAVANVSTELIGGFQLTDENVVKLLQENNREVPEELKITEESEPWSITFAQHAPITAVFEGNRVRIGVRCEQFTKGRNEDGQPDQEVNALVEIAANYQLFQGPQGAILRREGEVTVDFVGQKKLSTLQIATKTFLKRKFNTVFKPEIAGEGIPLQGPAGGGLAGKLHVREVLAHDGWLVAGLEQ